MAHEPENSGEQDTSRLKRRDMLRGGAGSRSGRWLRRYRGDKNRTRN